MHDWRSYLRHVFHDVTSCLGLIGSLWVVRGKYSVLGATQQLLLDFYRDVFPSRSWTQCMVILYGNKTDLYLILFIIIMQWSYGCFFFVKYSRYWFKLLFHYLYYFESIKIFFLLVWIMWCSIKTMLNCRSFF